MLGRERLRALKREIATLVAAFGDQRTPWYARAWLLLVLAYALSPIDLIPDPIPVLGLLDDALLIPLGVVVAIRLIPDEILDDCREAEHAAHARGVLVAAAAVVVATWAVTAWLLVRLIRGW